MRDLHGANALVLGMADSGDAAAELLAQKGARVTASDLKPLAELPGLEEKLERWGVSFAQQSDAVFRDRDLIVLSPGVPCDLPPLVEARARGVEVVGEVELAGWYLRGPVIGVTGSNGKTTTTTLVYEMMRRAGLPCRLGGNIGTPVCRMVAGSAPESWNVLELSSFQLESIKTFSALIGLGLNLTDNHLDRHQTMANYAHAKAMLFAHQTPAGAAVLNADNSYTRAWADLTPAEVIWFSTAGPRESGASLDGEQLLLDGAPLMLLSEIRVRGRHNAGNVLAAAAAARRAGTPVEAIRDTVLEFRGIEHRLEFVASRRGVDYYNDSKATTVASSIAAVESFAGRLWIILGGKDKGSDFSPLREPLLRRAKGVLLIGKAAEKIAGHLGPDLPYSHCRDLATAVDHAWRYAEAGDTVLLAPACASFDQFSSYEHRGRVFKELVAALPGGAT